MGEEIHDVLGDGFNAEILRIQLQSAGFEFREIQHAVDDAQQGLRATLNAMRMIRLIVRQPGVQQQSAHADNDVHRRADLVAHIAKELGLQARRLSHLLLGQLTFGDIDANANETLVFSPLVEARRV